MHSLSDTGFSPVTTEEGLAPRARSVGAATVPGQYGPVQLSDMKQGSPMTFGAALPKE
jgi:hypothetical protein